MSLRSRVRRSLSSALVLVATAFVLLPGSTASAGSPGPCGPPVVNPIACENSLPGDPPSDWTVTGAGDPSIQGFATSMSVNAGQTISFKINTPSPAYHIDILRLGYYGGLGARKIVANLKPSAALPQTQPACLTDSSNGLIDCGNWSVSASWTVPSTAVSGMYIAHLVRDDSQDSGGDSQIPFVVRDDSSHSSILLSTSDATWEAYNNYGGNSLYRCTVACPPGNPGGYKAAYAVSYNRPWDGSLATDGGASYLYYAEYQMVRFLEANGYNVSYTTDGEVDRAGSLLLNHRTFMTNGHDEYWSGAERANVQAARDAGVNLAFFTGNEVFWKTRWAASEDGSNTPYRTLITYKETHFDAPTDPQDPTTWTGTWGDPRFSPPADGGQPSNSLTGQEFVVNSGTSDITVPSTYSNLRMWRNTAVASLSPGQSLTLGAGDGTLGYEWDTVPDNGFQPPGEFNLSSTTVAGVQAFTDYGTHTVNGATETHHLSLYRAASGALVFGAGTVQWSWGLDNTNAWDNGQTDPSQNPPDPNMQQATVNLLADMGAQPATLMTGLQPGTASTDSTPPTSTISSPAAGANLSDGKQVTISGSATDTGGGVVAGVEVSTDGGHTWHPATINSAATTTNWSYTWVVHGYPTTAIESRAVDDSGNLESPSDSLTVNVSCPCSLWGARTPLSPDSGDSRSVEVGMKFRSDLFATVTGVRFYKAAANTGTHIGNLWTASGTNLGTVTFTNETASGWQQANFSTPVTIMPNTTYVVSYYAPVGHYSDDPGWFYPAPSPPPVGGGGFDYPPLHAIGNTTSPNGLYSYTAGSTFPVNTYQASNYWVDPVISPYPVPGPVSNVAATAGFANATVTWSAPSTGGPATSYSVTAVPATGPQTSVTVNGTPPVTTASFSNLQQGTPYTFTVQPANPNGAGPASTSNQVTPTGPTVPFAPTGVSAIPASGSASVSWTPPSNTNGSPISGYTITPYLNGSSAQAPTQVSNGSATVATVTGLTSGNSYTFTVSATNGIGTGPESTASSSVPIADTIFDFGTPATVDSGDGSAVELGTKFTADTSGTISGIRFYKAAANTGTHIGSLWTSSGTLLASATFSNETASGWQYVYFSNPVAISPGTTYVAGYFAPKGHYANNMFGFSSSIDNPPLHGVSTNTSVNGVYAYSSSSTFPTSSWRATNYWVDVMFTPTPPGAVSNVTATAGYAGATVTWSAPPNGGATQYLVTPYTSGGPQTPVKVTGNPPSASATISGLTPGTPYTFTVQASNSSGSGPVSGQSNSVTPMAPIAPSAPGNVSATSGTSSAQVSWSTPAANGSPITNYTITPFNGTTPLTPVPVTDPTATSATVSGLANGTSYTFAVSATSALGTGPAATTPPVTAANTLFDFGIPATPDSADGAAVEVGVKFTPSVNGSVLGVRFYKSAANTGTHVASLWTSGGTLLASANFSNETPSGWQQVTFAQPVAVTANTTYVAGYFAPKGHYSSDTYVFNNPITNGQLTAPANSTTPNGVFSYGSTGGFPTSAWHATNYWVDVLFTSP